MTFDVELFSSLNLFFYCVNTSYPMDNCFTGRRNRSRQTSEKDVLYILPAGPVTECAFARWRIVLHFLFAEDFLQRYVFEFLQRTLPSFLFFISTEYIYTTLLIIMSSPGQKRGSCGHVMALFDNHQKCARCRDKGVGDDPCVKKLDCQICKSFTPAQIHQLATPTYKERKERSEQKRAEGNASTTPTLVDPSEVTLLGRVSCDKSSPVDSTPKKKKRSDGSPRSSKRKHSSKPKEIFTSRSYAD